MWCVQLQPSRLDPLLQLVSPRVLLNPGCQASSGTEVDLLQTLSGQGRIRSLAGLEARLFDDRSKETNRPFIHSFIQLRRSELRAKDAELMPAGQLTATPSGFGL